VCGPTCSFPSLPDAGDATAEDAAADALNDDAVDDTITAEQSGVAETDGDAPVDSESAGDGR
jgi:hypothetical protein